MKSLIMGIENSKNIHRDKRGSLYLKNFTTSYGKFEEEAVLILFFMYKTYAIENYIEKSATDNIMEDLLTSVDETDPVGMHLKNIFGKLDSQAFFNMDIYEKTVNRMIFCRLIENFQAYLKDILTEVVLSKPDILKSKESERLDYILGFENYKDLIRALSEKKIEELSYKGFDDLSQFFETRLGISPFIEGDIEFLKVRIKERNLIVHNRAKLNKQFVKDAKLDESFIGREINPTFEAIIALLSFLNNEAVLIDDKISSKFSLPTMKSSVKFGKV